jgi:DNA-binding NarL/FixJ family response regulator
MSEEKGIEGNGNGNELVLIAGRPCRMRDSLHILLKTMPGIDIIGHADDGSSALRMITERQPALVLLDTNLPGEMFFTLLKRIKGNGCRSRCLVLADNVQQRQEAQAAGADAALVKGFPAVELFETIEGLLWDSNTDGNVSVPRRTM